ncbi:MAG: hypothetical protein ACK4GD_01215 [Sphingomonadaceae bacterium]
MSKQLTVSATLSVLAMALLAMAQGPLSGPASHSTAATAPVMFVAAAH